MKVLLLGCSSIAARRALPALKSLSAVEGIDAASRRGADAAASFAENGTAFASPEAALAKSDAALVYVSTENGMHAELAEAALSTGRHVVVDKPAFPDAKTTDRLLDRAEAAGLVLAEATVFLDHPRIAALTKLFEDGGRPTRVQACFSFPPLPADNFRYDPARGGGAFADLGPYAAATCRYFLGEAPDDISCRILSRAAVETAFAVTATASDGRCFSGIYGFDTEYQNWVSATGPGIAVRLDRFCTPPPDVSLPLQVRQNNEERMIETDAGDCFAGMFARLLAAIETGETAALHDAARADAAFRDRLRENAV